MSRKGQEAGDPATNYAAAVASGEIVAGPHVRAACARHLRDVEKRKDLVWDREAAERAIRFFRTVLRLNGGQFEGMAFELQPSQAFIVGSIFGWKRQDGSRRFRRAYIEEGKGNGKSPLAAGIGLYGLVADDEPRAEIYAAARTKDQAMVLFRDAVAMVDQSPGLAKRLVKSGGNPVWNLGDLKTGSFFRPISSDDGKSGPRPHMALVDEVHEHRDRLMIEMLERGFKWRRNPLLLMITNSGSDRNSVCWEEHTAAIKAASGEHDAEPQFDRTFAFVCALDDDDDPLEDSGCWIKANPLLGVTQPEAELAAAVSQAKAIPGRLNNILRLHFCVWTDAESAWIDRAAWEACEDEDLSLDDFDGEPCFVGLDLSASRDLTAKVLVFPDGETEDGKPKYAAFAHGYTPKDTLTERARQDQAPYDVWTQQGHLTATPGKLVRLDYVASDLVSDAGRFEIQAVAYDLWLVKRFAEELDALGVELPLMEHPQGFGSRQSTPLRMPDSINAIEELILEGRIRIAVNPALRSAVMSAAFDASPAGLRRFTKQRATGRIDMAVALAMAVGAATDQSGKPKGKLDDFLANPIMAA